MGFLIDEDEILIILIEILEKKLEPCASLTLTQPHG
jgi:hypothetical protein